VGLWHYIWLPARDVPILVFTVCCYTGSVHTMAASLHESPLAIESLLKSPLESLHQSLLQNLHERAALREELSSPPLEAFGRWQTLCLRKLCLTEASKSVEALANGRLYVWKLLLMEGFKSGSFG
jgi:hypothetical protein